MLLAISNIQQAKARVKPVKMLDAKAKEGERSFRHKMAAVVVVFS
jgi:hypothetical protein